MEGSNTKYQKIETKEKKVISERKVVLFRPSKELKKIINKNHENEK